jgi:hypothetical protein
MHPLGRSGLIKPSSTPGLIYELKPNLDTYFKLVRFRTNSRGLRDKEYSVEKPAGTFRVVVVGDSFTMASGVDIEDAFHTDLEDRLNRESEDVSYEFINFGVGGYDPNQYLSSFEHRALYFDPDLLLFCMSGPLDGFYADARRDQPYVVKPPSRPFFESFLEKLIRHNLRSLRPRWEDEALRSQSDKEALKKLERVFLKLDHIADGIGIPVCVVLLQRTHSLREATLEVQKMAERHGFHAVDTAPSFENTSPLDYIICKIDHHPDAKANGIFAEVIYDYLKGQHLLVERGP